MRTHCLIAVALMLALPACGCRARQRPVNVVGSTSVLPFAEYLAQKFEKQTGNRVTVQGGGSTAGILALDAGLADIGMCSRSLNPDEQAKYTAIVIAQDGLAVVVHPSNPVKGLSRQQIQRIFSGQITNWREVGGRNARIVVVVREAGSGTRESFSKLVMGKARAMQRALVQESNGTIREVVRSNPDAVGYMSLGLVGELHALDIDGVRPTPPGVMDKSYTLSRPFLFVVKQPLRPDARQFIDYVLSPEGQAELEREGLVRAQ